MNKIISKNEEKVENSLDIIASAMLLIVYFVTFILIIVGLFKILYYAKKEPSNRNIYIRNNFLNYYEEGEFCYDYFEDFIIKGALDTFDISIKNIKKYTRALLGTIFITIFSLIISPILICFSKCKHDESYMWAALCFYVIFVLAFILNVIFAIVLAHYYFKGDYNDFEEFSRCRYLTRRFKWDYQFVFKIKNAFNMPFVLILITELFNFLKLVAEAGDKKYLENY